MYRRDSCIWMIRAAILGAVAWAWAHQAAPAAAESGRAAAVYLSDGSVLSGELRLSPGRSFRLNLPRGGTLKTTDIFGNEVPYGKVRQFTLEPLREIRFFAQKEEMLRKWRFTGKTSYDEQTAQADWTAAPKEYFGDLYPVRYLGAQVCFTDGQVLEGHLYSAVAYLVAADKTHKLLLVSKQRGPEGQRLDDLLYVQRILFVDNTDPVAGGITLRFTDLALGPSDGVYALTCDSLTPLPARPADSAGVFRVEATFGEGVHLALQRDGRCYVGWPAASPADLFALAADHLRRHRDFYNEKTLLGVCHPDDPGQVLTLVNLRRRYDPTHFGEVGGEWDSVRQTVVEPWRLSVWRWKYDPQTRQMALLARGTFQRRILLPEEPTPEVTILPSLWNLQPGQGEITITTGLSPSPVKSGGPDPVPDPKKK
ncbi:MAG: hypothetical protein JW810_10730 [Sedimentisphaerales bacterium]|nr:hypothetical protein [Sedimentisphaerales bacterium]